jgi:hypothetical protein
LEPAELRGRLESEPRVLQDLQVLLAHREGRPELPELLARAQRVLRDYLVLTELLELRVFVEPQVAQDRLGNKVQLDNKVLQESAQVELRELQDSKAQLGQKALLEWLALAELQD